MAIIYSYPEIGTLAAGDLMPITDISDQVNGTKSVPMSKLTDYFKVTLFSTLTTNQIPVYDGSTLVDSIMKQNVSGTNPVLEIGSLPAGTWGSIQAKVYGGLEVEPSQPDFNNDAQFSVLSDNQGTGSPEPKIIIPSNYDRVGINSTYNDVSSSNHALLVKSGYQNGSQLLELKSDNNLVKLTFSNENSNVGFGDNLILHHHDPNAAGGVLCTIGFASGNSPDVTKMPLQVQKLVNNLPNNQATIVRLPYLVEFADDSAAAAGGLPVGGLYHTAGVVKVRLV